MRTLGQHTQYWTVVSLQRVAVTLGWAVHRQVEIASIVAWPNRRSYLLVAWVADGEEYWCYRRPSHATARVTSCSTIPV
jgi:hypothetical protein